MLETQLNRADLKVSKYIIPYKQNAVSGLESQSLPSNCNKNEPRDGVGHCQESGKKKKKKNYENFSERNYSSFYCD